MMLPLAMSTPAFTWGDSQQLFWALALIPLGLGLLFWLLWRKRTREQLQRQGPLGALLEGQGLGRDILRASLIFASTLLCVLALAKPRYGTSEESVKSLGIDVVFVVDASKSMKLSDVVPDRLGAARHEIQRLLKTLNGGRAAFVPFAGLAFEQTGLTGDFGVLRSDLDAFRIEDMPRGGTAIGRGLSQALITLFPELDANAPTADTYEREVKSYEGAKHKAIVLFTDGEDHEGDALEAAKEAAKRGVKIFTVGVGTAQGRPVLNIDADGRVHGTVKGPDGTTPIFSSLNVKLLKDIAGTTGGDYFLLGPDGLGDGLLNALGELERAEYAMVYQDLGEERFRWALLPAFLLLGLELFLSNRKRS